MDTISLSIVNKLTINFITQTFKNFEDKFLNYQNIWLRVIDKIYLHAFDNNNFLARTLWEKISPATTFGETYGA